MVELSLLSLSLSCSRSLPLSLSLSPSLSLNLDYYRSAVFDSFVSEDIFRYTNSHQNQIKIKQKIFSCSITTSIDIDPSKHFTTKHIKANNASFNGVFVIVYFVVRFWRKTFWQKWGDEWV